VGDFNGDGKLDLAVSMDIPSVVSILLGNGDGTFQAGIDTALTCPCTSLSVADLNRDGNLDLVLDTWPEDVTVLLGKGDGTFQPAVNYAMPKDVGYLAVSDFNGDGNPDLAVLIGNDGDAVSIMLGNGDGSFQPEVFFSAGVTPGFISVGDFNGDGKPDLAIASQTRSNGRMTILTNTTR
jgi:hypothetical protein